MIKYIAAAILTALPLGGKSNPPPEPKPDEPAEASIAAIVDGAADTCARVDAYVFATGHGPDDAMLVESIERFKEDWAGTPGLDDLAWLYLGVIVGCVAGDGPNYSGA